MKQMPGDAFVVKLSRGGSRRAWATDWPGKLRAALDGHR